MFELITDPDLPAVGGGRLPTSLAEFERRCRVLLRDEQAKPNPDNALVDALCNGVRLAREYDRSVFGTERDRITAVSAALLGERVTDPEFPRALWPIEVVRTVVQAASAVHLRGGLIPDDDDREATGNVIAEAVLAVNTLCGAARALVT